MTDLELDQLQRPVVVDDQRAAGLRFGDARAMALLAALCAYRLLPQGFTNRDLRQYVAPLLGLTVEQLRRGQMTYDLRRLRLRGLIARIPTTHRYRVTDHGFRIAILLTRIHGRLLRRGLAIAYDPLAKSGLRTAMVALDDAIDRLAA